VVPPAGLAALQRAGMVMDYGDAMFHMERGERVVRLAWGSFKARRQVLDEDRLAGDWVVVDKRRVV
jgi:hypothetical protein